MVNHNYFTQRDVERLEEQAVQIRQDIISMIHAAKAGHPGGSLSAVEMVTALYFHVLNIDPQNPGWADRDRFILSKGHSCPVLYAALARRGYFDPKELNTLRQYHSILQGHPDMNKTPGVDMTAGSLGNGLSVGVGMALSGKLHHQDYMTYVMLGDGEIQEGQVWEAFMFAHHYKLDNLCVIIDNNGLQIDGAVDKVMSPYPIPDKLKAFGFAVKEIDGHDFDQIEAAFAEAKATKGVPFAIVMKTTKGKGVSYMENQAGWHGKAPNDEEYKIAMDELTAQLAEVEAM
mgnify:CR=1 FL=1